jgi:2-polyprenyl-3-methyl-5-hydroxy-6-metoxy-1,4-benzoquinol methylase
MNCNYQNFPVSKIKKHKIVKYIDEANLKYSALWTAEAKFGFSHLKKKIESLRVKSNILEVGCGSGILMSMLIEEHPEHNFFGIEPFLDGFDQLKILNSLVKNMGVNLSNESYEKHVPESKYDLIYCINVFEHVKDWQHFIRWASSNLNNGGTFLILCPNYGFPYESHFQIPVIFNKDLTYKIFKKHIKNFEKKNDFHGMWNSINFVKKKSIRKFVNQNTKSLKFKINDDISIIDSMLSRVTHDFEFRKRQNFIGFVAVIFKKIGLFNLIKLAPNYIPYMKISFVKKSL